MTNLVSGNDSDPTAVRIALKIAKRLVQESSKEGFLQQTLPDLLNTLGSQFGGLVSQRNGTWDCDYWVGPQQPLPVGLIGEAIDQSSIRTSSQWCVAPLPIHSRIGSIPIEGVRTASALVIEMTDSQGHDPHNEELIQATTSLLAGALQRIHIQQQQGRRIEQLAAVLSAAAEWQQLDDDEALLHKIADTATAILKCERASIFLWDRRRRMLIGRPALGIEGGVLEVDDDAGVVGEVLATGEWKVWNGGSDDESRVNRKVDEKLEFQTRSLVAVPMSSGRGDLIGVFEAINAKDDDFEHEDAVVLADLAKHAAVAIESLRTRKRLTADRDRLVDDAAATASLIGEHSSVENVRKQAAKVARTELSVLVLGKNGTGKEVLARMIHYQSDRRNGPFIAVNCAALVETLLESELFGHEKGAFTDANQSRSGKFELASGGTLFLDEVGDMSPGGQAKLLRVLEDKVVVRVGGSKTIPVDVRVIAATNQPLESMIAEKRFREDLFFRLNVVSLTLPPLAERGNDVLLLANHFTEQFCYQIGRQVPQYSESAKDALLTHAWPGNIRELRNTIERVCYLCSEDVVGVEDLMLGGTTTGSTAAVTGHIKSPALTEATKEFQVEHIQRAIASCGGNMTDAASRLGLHRSNLYRKMRQLGMATSSSDDD
ncbi:sigma-54-dependent Fis family transcriptional regulator [Rubripirellula amarantea]|uniref:sigma-54-dependent Fis family transcriptional regulator n=1 Tax=Rubripirellula amarantea TaxID=2527999 RepID=UPI001F5E492F|nr:sigma-54-dependent Fis family transcriptional regulator [Rubripirellula amarantea]